MKTTKKKHFYKLVLMDCSRFAEMYHINSIDDIYPGQVFIARGKPFEWCQDLDDDLYPKPAVPVFTAEPVIHFCDNAIDTLMWYFTGLGDNISFYEAYFLEVVPTIPVYKQVCIDENKLWQCGARAIKVIRHVPYGEMLRIADKEIKRNRVGIINRYPNKNMFKLIQYIKNNVYKKSK